MDRYETYYDPDQLYNLENDPSESTNLATVPENAAKLEHMKALLTEHLADKAGGFAEFKEDPHASLPEAERAKIGDALMQVVFH